MLHIGAGYILSRFLLLDLHHEKESEDERKTGFIFAFFLESAARLSLRALLAIQVIYSLFRHFC